jgi:hypothetical protein
MFTRKLIGILGVTPLLCGQLAVAQEEVKTQSFDVSANLDAKQVSNASLSTDPAAEVDEMQTEARLLMVGGLRGRLADFQTDYALNSRHYSEFSDRNEDLLLGQSIVRLGPESRRHYLELSHSSREIAIDPLLGDLTSNRDTRTVLTAGAFTSLRLDASNWLSLQANLSDFQFRKSIENEAKTVGYGLNYGRRLNPLYEAGLSLSGYNLEYRYVDDELDYNQVALFWRGKLRRSEYSLTAGSNTMKQLDQTQTAPLLVATWAYNLAGQTLSLSASRKLSDTSHGSDSSTSAAGMSAPGSADFLGSTGSGAAGAGAVGVDGRVQVRDQFTLTELDLAWRHERLFDRCAVELGLGMQDEEYLQFTDFSSRSVGFNAATEYQLNSRVTLKLNADLNSYAATELQGVNDYTSSNLAFSVIFPRLIRDGSATVYVGRDQRDYDLIPGYTSNFVGARFQYVLVDR